MGCFESMASMPELAKGQGRMAGKASLSEDILSHYLKYESSITPFASPDLIRRRMILEHNFLDLVSRKTYSETAAINQTVLMRSWCQRIFLECIDEAEIEFFKDKRPYDDVRRKIAERYLFELYEACEFMNAGLPNARSANPDMLRSLILPLSVTGQNSDSALYAILKGLKEKFPQVADSSKVEFPKVDERKQDVNLLDNIPNLRSFSDPAHMNFNTTLFDIEFLIERALSEFADFKTDMKALLGDEVLADAKVKKTEKDGQKVYSASAVRRVFIKWVETVFERIPNIRETALYKLFLVSKKIIFDGFQVGGGGFGANIQEVVMYILLQLIEISKFTYDSKAKKYEKNPAFGFYIYDLLRCKIHRPTAGEIMKVLDDMCKTATTASGKKFKVVRIKNRFKTPNRDLMVNFQYGDVIVGEAQLCVDTTDVDEKAQKTNKFNHYLYELERGLFGPTVELMMQYEDFNRPDQVTRMYWMEELEDRNPNFYVTGEIRPIKTKCPSGHEMITASENYFLEVPGMNKQQQAMTTFECDYCFRTGLSFNKPYTYCEKCSWFFCKAPACEEAYKKSVSEKSLLFCCNVLVPELELKSPAELAALLQQKKALLVVFYHPDIQACVVLKDYLTLIFVMIKSKNVTMMIKFCDVSQPALKQLADKHKLTKFPSSVVFDQKETALKTLIGASIQVVDGLDAFRGQASISKTPALQVKCKFPRCAGVLGNKAPVLQLVAAGEEEGIDFKCQQCLGINIDDTFSGAFMEGFNSERNKVFQCPTCRTYTCVKCGFLGYPEPATYQDPMGVSYLSSALATPKSIKDPSGHLLGVTHANVNRQAKYDCFQCNANFFFNREMGMGYCEQCRLFACPKCLGLDAGEMDTRFGKEVACHFMEASAPETRKCTGCKKNFKKVYVSRLTKDGQAGAENKVDFMDELAEALKSPLKEWKCCLCKDTFDDGILHLSCIRCNYEMCLACAEKSDIFYVSEKFVEEQDTSFRCPTGHAIKVSYKSPKPGETLVTCQCKRLMYPNSEHFTCETCNKFWCVYCAGSNLQRTGLTCTRGHPLAQRKLNPTGLAQRCGYDPGHIILKKEPYLTCTKCDDFVFCSADGCRGANISEEMQCPRGHGADLLAIQPRAKFICSKGSDCYYIKKGKTEVLSDYLACQQCIDNETRDNPAYRVCWACMTGKTAQEIEQEEDVWNQMLLEAVDD